LHGQATEHARARRRSRQFFQLSRTIEGVEVDAKLMRPGDVGFALDGIAETEALAGDSQL
jgi:hypothetical protein